VAVRLRHALLEARNHRQVLREGDLAVAGHGGVVARQRRNVVLVEFALARDRVQLHWRLVRLHLCPQAEDERLEPAPRAATVVGEGQIIALRLGRDIGRIDRHQHVPAQRGDLEQAGDAERLGLGVILVDGLPVYPQRYAVLVKLVARDERLDGCTEHLPLEVGIGTLGMIGTAPVYDARWATGRGVPPAVRNVHRHKPIGARLVCKQPTVPKGVGAPGARRLPDPALLLKPRVRHHEHRHRQLKVCGERRVGRGAQQFRISLPPDCKLSELNPAFTVVVTTIGVDVHVPEDRLRLHDRHLRPAGRWSRHHAHHLCLRDAALAVRIEEIKGRPARVLGGR
jgi:hypothetical protein